MRTQHGTQCSSMPVFHSCVRCTGSTCLLSLMPSGAPPAGHQAGQQPWGPMPGWLTWTLSRQLAGKCMLLLKFAGQGT